MFYCKLGDIETSTPWMRPTIDSFRRWSMEWVQLNNLSDFDVYLVGGFAEKLNNYDLETWDVDIVLRGDIQSFENLKSVMDSAVSLGFSNCMLIDIMWVSDSVWTQHLNIRTGNPIDTSLEYVRYRNFDVFTKISDEVESVVDLKTMFEVEEVISGLFKISGFDDRTANKVLKKVEDDIYKGIYVDLKNVVR